MASLGKNYIRIGESTWKDVDKISTELFSLTYGAIVQQLIRDHNDDYDQINIQLEKMGYNIGIRLIEELLARSNVGRCKNFRDTAEVVAKVGFKMFFGVSGNVINFDEKEKKFSLSLDDNPLTELVELPDSCSKKLWYSNVLCGVIRGAMEMVQMRVECKMSKCILRGDDTTEILVVLKEILKEEIPVGED